jgi:uncharacterized protein
MSSPDSAPRITPRNIQFRFDEVQDAAWLGGDLCRSAIFDALSVGFPRGERFFMDSVRAFSSRAAGSPLSADIKGFLAQEAIHSREHVAYNQFLEASGVDVARIERQHEAKLSRVRKRLSPERQLAVTVCLEHITAIFADQLITDPAYLQGAEDWFRKIWLWHAIEEIEHKSVAFDVLLLAVPTKFTRYRMRCLLMLLATFNFVIQWMRDIRSVLTGQGIQMTWRVRLSIALQLWAKPGLLRRMILPWLAFFKPGFHPWQHNNRSNIKEIEVWLGVNGAPIFSELAQQN